MSTVHAFTDDALGDLDALGVAARIRGGEVSREEVLEAAITRVGKVQPHLNAVQVECFDRARNQPPTSGPFAGVPTFVKDNADVAGVPTCHGSAAFTPYPATADSAPAHQFLAQGFTVLGKSTLCEFGLTASTEYVDRPPTRNPWNTDYSVGASSGGSAALVASGAVPIAHANDGGGSIRIPAAVTGLVGLKPTRNRLLDQPGARQLPVNLVCEGVLTRTVRDTAHYLAAAERHRPEPGLAPVGLVEGPADRRLRIGVIRYDVLGRPVHPETDRILSSAAEMFADRGHELTERRLLVDVQFVEDFTLYWSLFAVLMSAGFLVNHGRRFDPRKLDPFTRGLARKVARNPHRLPGAIRRLRGGPELYARHFADVDVLLTPTLAHPAPRIGEHHPGQPADELFAKLIDYVGFTPLANVGGGPAISLPHGRHTHGLPGSVQIFAPHGGERTLLQLAYELEAVAPFPRITE
ncbi:amidase [Nocardia higoensis]|uniref:amidase n=1 Tax=Nocardia higoensis TaxID=228599 RepID=A0ABS0D3U7_9NOCA|nr:amidase [Nocardia higoensis]MBF6353160.1 amidase [Nocardia higoensis]